MSVKFSDSAALSTGNLRFRYDIPTSVASKAANVAYTTLFFFRTPKAALLGSGHSPTMMARLGGAPTGGNDGLVAINQAVDTLSVNINLSGSPILNSSVAIARDRVYMVMVIGNSANSYLVICEPGGSPTVVASLGTNGLFTTNMSTNHTWAGIGGGYGSSNRPFYGEMEHVAMWTGQFPEAAGSPDLTLIANLASGAQPIETLTTPAPSLTPRFYYPLAHEADLTNVFGGASLTLPGIHNRETGICAYQSGPLRPARLMPARIAHGVSQVVFGTRGTPATATAQIKVEGGSYNGLPAMSKVQARLVSENTRTLVADWIDMATTAPSGGAGTWAANETGFTGVPMQTGYLFCEFRAVDSGGTVIAGPVPGYSLKGAGFRLLGQAQSQLDRLANGQGGQGGSGAFVSGTRSIHVTQFGNEFIPAGIEPEQPANPYDTSVWNVGSDASLSIGAVGGIRTMIEEINAVYPAVPIQYDHIALGGTGLAEFSDVVTPGTPGKVALRWNALKAALGIVQPYYQLHLGHSSDTGGTQTKLAAVVAYSQANFGTPIKYLHAPVPRYREAGTGSIFTATSESRAGARAYVLANPSMNVWLGSWSTVFTQLGNGSGSGVNMGPVGFESTFGPEPHSAPASLHGEGRTGSFIAWGLLMASGAIPDVPIGITAVRKVGTNTMRIEFGPINA